MRIVKRIFQEIRRYGLILTWWYCCFYVLRKIMPSAARLCGRVMHSLESRSLYMDFSEELRPITRGEFLVLEMSHPYYRGRWEYYGAAVDLIKADRPKSVLELGPHQFSLVKGADVMDRSGAMESVAYRYDATKTPWPIENKKYDLFVALQVWEHLEGKQQEAFSEVMRVSRRAILSFPYKWDCPGDCHHAIDDEVIGKWTKRTAPKKTSQVGPRKLYYYVFGA